MDWNLHRQSLDDEMDLPDDDDDTLADRMFQLQAEVEAEAPRRRKTYLDVIAENTKKLRSRPPRPDPRPPLHHCHSVICQRRIGLSTRLHKLGDLRAALCADRDAVAADPGCDLGWLQRGLTEYALKQYTEARSSFERVLQLAEGVEYPVAGRGGSFVSSVEPAVAAKARAMVQRLDELEAEQQVCFCCSRRQFRVVRAMLWLWIYSLSPCLRPSLPRSLPLPLSFARSLGCGSYEQRGAKGGESPTEEADGRSTGLLEREE